MTVNGVPRALTSETFGDGWHRVESDGNGTGWRWTDGGGDVRVAGGRVLDIEISQTGRYWLDACDSAAAATAAA